MTDYNDQVALRRLKSRHMKRINRQAHAWASELQPAFRDYLLACIAIELEANPGLDADIVVATELTSNGVNVADALEWLRCRGVFS